MPTGSLLWERYCRSRTKPIQSFPQCAFSFDLLLKWKSGIRFGMVNVLALFGVEEDWSKNNYHRYLSHFFFLTNLWQINNVSPTSSWEYDITKQIVNDMKEIYKDMKAKVKSPDRDSLMFWKTVIWHHGCLLVGAWLVRLSLVVNDVMCNLIGSWRCNMV